jgi:hypothetical protein
MSHQLNIILACIFVIFFIIVICVVLYLQKNNESFHDVSINPEHMQIIESIKLDLVSLDNRLTHIPIREGKSSYTTNKSRITLCMKAPKTGVTYSYNTLMFVAIHEAAHVITKSRGHGPEFVANFKTLLNRAIERGLFNPMEPVPKNYCK